MKILPLIIASAALVYSCDKKESTSKENSEISAPKTDSANGTATASANVIDQNAELVAQVPANAVAANTPREKPALNPAHGEPYHRCEIPVGAPIDSAPQQNAAPQVPSPQMQTSTTNFNTNPISPSMSGPVATPVSEPQATGPKPALNPAHGEPHHRCDLQVGAPLT